MSEATSSATAMTPKRHAPSTIPAGPGAWVQRHEAVIWRWLRGLGAPRDVAQDLLQDALLAALARPDWSQWSDETSRSWLRAAARNLWLMHLRTEARRRRRERTFAEQTALDESPEPDPPFLDALRRCRDELSPRARQALELRYGQNASREEMAAALSMRPEGIKSLLQRIRGALRDCIEQHARP